jgi:hypothetical protein
MSDIVAQYPNLILDLMDSHDQSFEYEAGFTAKTDNGHFFIHCRAVLPLKDIDNGIGFGIWVEVDQSAYEKYVEVVDVDDKYKDFVADGFLAHDWPGFPETEGLKVKIRPIRVEEKVYITEVLETPADIALEMAHQMSPDDTHQKELLLKMIQAAL